MHRATPIPTVAMVAVALLPFVSVPDATAEGPSEAGARDEPAPEELSRKLEAVKQQLEERQRSLALSALPDEEWAVGHVGLTLARGKAAAADRRAEAGRFGEALTALASCQELLDTRSGRAELVHGGGVSVGIVLGHPYMANKRAVYVWAKPEDGAGLMGLYDRGDLPPDGAVGDRELLSVDPQSAALWEVVVTEKLAPWDTLADCPSFLNQGRPCTLEFRADESGGRLIFRWSEGIVVKVEQRLGPQDALLRGTIEVSAEQGLVVVIFPLVRGIKPLTPDSSRDHILDAGKFGDLKPSPLLNGKIPDYTGCPPAMQFSALIGDRRGLYFAEEDGQANRKLFMWRAHADDAGAGTAYSEKVDTPAHRASPDQADRDLDLLTFSIEHPVLGWGSQEPSEQYRSPGDLVLGPFSGDWYDAARTYRKWALTAPWCAKGPIYERVDYPRWFLEAPNWTFGGLGDERGIEEALAKHAFYEVPTMISHVYNYYFPLHQDDRYPEYFPPRLGSVGLREAVKRLQAEGIRVVPYINGTLYDMDTESFRMDHAEREGGLWLTPDAEKNITTRYGGGASMMRMCPGSPFWRKRMLADAVELVGRYGVDGVYVDFLTDHNVDCYNEAHGHPVTGGDFWTRAVHDLYAELHQTAKELNPDAILTSEGVGEYVIDVHETFFSNGTTGTAAPLFHAVYHGYANTYGGIYGKTDPLHVGRWWLMGSQNGWHGGHLAAGTYYRDLLKCRWEFGTPYLGYGEMLRPPEIASELPSVSSTSGYGTITVPAVEGSAWKAPDGTVGIFFLNYDEENSYDFDWAVDLAETGIGPSTRLTMSRWTLGSGLSPLKQVEGGRLTEAMTVEPLGVIALKLEVTK